MSFPRDDIKILPVISNFLVNSKLSKDNLLKTLNLMSVISYRIKVGSSLHFSK